MFSEAQYNHCTEAHVCTQLVYIGKIIQQCNQFSVFYFFLLCANRHWENALCRNCVNNKGDGKPMARKHFVSK